MSDEERMRVSEPRSDTTPEWEVFLRSEANDPLRHVGSVTAPSESVAREQASSLFGWTAETLWLCRADDVARYSIRALGEDETEPGEAPAAGGVNQ
ncbi:MAG: Htur_1727 family rSAM-partnered candidate RiPP [Halobellus sp.]|uniref:Htur_1727 family rSAM-partnered candidate RiPP n=1 Tax=Halobellus sp. TaxID=1979212 RepID=UPI0035D3E13E